MSTSPLRIIFAGTPEFAAIALEALSLTRHEIVAVYTQPDRASGRGLKITESPVKSLAFKLNLPIFQPESLKGEREQNELRQFNADVMVVAAYGLILPKAVLTIPRHGCINIHASLLPRWRGAAPIHRAILAGDKTSGVTIMQMAEGLDTGDMLVKHAYTLTPEETSQTLHDQLAKMGAEGIVEALELLAAGKLVPEKQDDSQTTYAKKITKDEGLIDWHDTAENIERKIRAFTPWPGTHTNWNGTSVKIGAAVLLNKSKQTEPGSIVNASAEGIDVAAADGVIRILKLQLPGAKMITARDFVNSHRDKLIGRLG